jgi:uncharacterized protein with FMN-binding domain
MSDPEQGKYRDLFESLEKEATGAKSARSSGRVSSRMVGAGCAAIIAVYGAGYARTQSAADAFTRQLAVRRVAAPPLPGVDVVLDRKDIPHPRVETATVAKERREPAKAAARGAVRVDEAESQTSTEAPPEAPASPAAAPVSAAPHDSVSPTPATPAVAPPPAIERPADPPPPVKLAEAAPAPPPAAHWKDGTYTGWGYSRHGNIEAQVVIENGRIAAATISQCRTRYSCSVIDRLPPEVAQRQSPEVDWVSGATQSADAFYGAVVEALGKAK